MGKKKLIMAGLAGAIAVLLLIIGVLAWKISQANNSETEKNKETSQRIVGKVAELYLVPTSEPTVALIKDKAKLGNQEFFKNARDGDYLLIYQKDKIAMVYREEANKLVTVGPVNIGEDGETGDTQTESIAP